MVGKPSSVFFETAVKDIGARPESVSMNIKKSKTSDRSRIRIKGHFGKNVEYHIYLEKKVFADW